MGKSTFKIHEIDNHPTKNPLSNDEIKMINSLMDLRVDVVTK